MVHLLLLILRILRLRFLRELAEEIVFNYAFLLRLLRLLEHHALFEARLEWVLATEHAAAAAAKVEAGREIV